MGTVVLDMTMSLNGCVAGPDGEDAGLHDWYFSPSGGAQEIIDELIRTTGAIVMGKRTYEAGASQRGFADNPYQVDHFVLCHQAPSQAAEGNTAVTFVTDGIHNAVARAQASAVDRNVVIGGGATIARLCLDAGLIDEIRIALRPLVINGGLQLFHRLEGRISLEPGEMKATPDVTHLRYHVVK
jgi:dihydrofolate reductase